MLNGKVNAKAIEIYKLGLASGTVIRMSAEFLNPIKKNCHHSDKEERTGGFKILDRIKL